MRLPAIVILLVIASAMALPATTQPKQPVIQNGKATTKSTESGKQGNNEPPSANTANTPQQNPKATSKAGETKTGSDDRIYTVKVLPQSPDRWYRTGVIISAAVAAVGFGTLFVVWRQRGIMQGQLKSMQDTVTKTDALIGETRKAADAAKDSAAAATASVDALVESERAWVLASMEKTQVIPGTTAYFLTLTNRGRTPARISHIAYKFTAVSRIEDLPPEPLYELMERGRLLAPQEPWQVSIESMPVSVGGMPKWKAALDSGKFWIYYGCVIYRDIFRKTEHHTGFCFRYYKTDDLYLFEGPPNYTTYA